MSKKISKQWVSKKFVEVSFSVDLAILSFAIVVDKPTLVKNAREVKF